MMSSLNARLPPLLISTSFTVDSYKIYLTDLTHLWCEVLDRRSILRRSLAEDTSIDPSQDSRQFKVFLEKIRLGLGGGKDVNLFLSLGSRASKGGPLGVKSLDISLSIILPHPFEPLKWTFELNPCPQSDFVAHFTLPLLQAQTARLRELESLAGILRDKDHVIQKLVDKLEATGAELGHVFPGAAGKGGRKVPRKVAEERVKGLGAFDQETWRNEMKTLGNEDERNDAKAIVQNAFPDKTDLELPDVDAEAPRSWGSWCEQLKDEAIFVSTGEDKEDDIRDLAHRKTTATKAAREEQGIDDDDFQVRATPPAQSRLSPKPKTPPSHQARNRPIIDDEETEDEDDLGATSQSQPSAVPDSFAARKPKAPAPSKKLGGIGGPKRAAAKTKTPTPEPEPDVRNTRSHKPVDDDETASEDEDAVPPPGKSISPQKRASAPAKPHDDDEIETEDETTSPAPREPSTPPKPAPPPPAAKPSRKGGIGKLGGKKKAASPPPSSPADDTLPTTESHLPTQRTLSKLGRIGHKHGDEAADDAEGQRGRSETKTETEKEKPRETSEERAQRKREELKRQLEQPKAPGRKKRKF